MASFSKAFLWPLSALYGLAVRFRNHLFNIGYWRSFRFETCVICVGNLSAGGNGKTPMVETLVRLMKDRYSLAVLSRGYGRSTRGFKILDPGQTASEVGDEPYQLYGKFGSEITVAVGEDRALAITKILFERPQIKVILLDDGFQHRAVDAQYNIVVTAFENPFFNDRLLPWGRLREPASGVARAQAVVVTKCPPDLTPAEQDRYRSAIQKFCAGIPVYFSTLRYLPALKVTGGEALKGSCRVFLFSGIARADGLERYVSQQHQLLEHQRFPDHYQYKPRDIKALEKAFKEQPGEGNVMLTTEKDMVRLQEFPQLIDHLPLYYLPIEFDWLPGSQHFEELLMNTVQSISDNLP